LYARFNAEEYIDELASWIEHKSINDVNFGFELNPAVCSKRFFLAVNDMLCHPISPLTICFGESGGDRIIITSQRRLNIISASMAADANAEAYRTKVASVRGASCSLIDQFLSANQNPEVCSAMDFDQCIALSTDFYFLTPITDGPYLRGLFSRLTNSKILLSVSYSTLVMLGPKGLMSCSCSAFLHRAWCIHACVCAFKRQIIVKYPPNMDPTSRDVKPGRPTSAKKQKVGWERDLEAGGLCGEIDKDVAVVLGQPIEGAPPSV
jgi:hypothetical protein